MIDRYFTPGAAAFIREEIEKASGNEVFFVAKTDEDSGLICEARVLARGNRSAVPAILGAPKTGDVVIHNHPSGNVQPSTQDVSLASAFGNRGVGFYIVDSAVSKVYVVVEPFVPGETVAVDPETAREYLRPGGAVAEVMGEKYECRDEQLQVLSNVVEAFNDERISMIEAGTGTGKTLSYLVPSVLWFLENGERVVISTNTINLQEQLINKDLPLLRDVFPKKFDYALVKGMRNYFCVLRGNAVREDLFTSLEEEGDGGMGAILKWAEATRDGSLSDLGFTPRDEDWERVSAESESCPGGRCPHYSECFFYKSRRELANAAVIVSNHHVLFSDMAIKGASGTDSSFGIIPPYTKVVFDEAHNIAEAATSHFSAKFSKHGLLKTLGRLLSKKKKGASAGLVSYISRLAEGEKNSVLKAIFEGAAGAFLTLAEEAERKGRDAFDSLYAFGKEVCGEEKSVSVRLTEGVSGSRKWTGIEKKFRALDSSLAALRREITHFVKVVEGATQGDSHIKITAEMGGVAARLAAYCEVAGRFFGKGEESHVRWFEGSRRRQAVFCSVNLTPLDVSPELEEKLYSKTKTVVMTSASLTVDRNFDFQKKSVGLSENERFRGLVVKSPFDYKRQSLLLVPTDMPGPGREDYAGSVADILFAAFSVTNGNALVLFTSYSSLNSVYEKVAAAFEKTEFSPITLLRQGDMPRSALLERFKKIGNCVLFATDSFWEGVDVPGDSLRLVVICRLPFKVPSDPITEARIEHMKKHDVDSFQEYMLPLAVLKFKQGFGRLIRSKTDKGVVMVLDNRVVTKSYGRFFINSVSESGFYCGSTDEVLGRLAGFFDG